MRMTKEERVAQLKLAKKKIDEHLSAISSLVGELGGCECCMSYSCTIHNDLFSLQHSIDSEVRRARTSIGKVPP